MPDETIVPTPFNIYAEIKLAIADQSPKVKTQIIQSYVDKELTRFLEATSKALEALEGFKSEAKKIKADVTTYNLDGTVANESYSKAAVDKSKELKEKITKYENAIDQALVQNDFKKVLELK